MAYGKETWMKKPMVIMLLLIGCVVLSSGDVFSQDGDAESSNVRDFVRKHYIHGIKYEAAKAFGPTAIPYLVEMLNDNKEKEFWVNIIVTLGFIEDSSALDALIAYLENLRGKVDAYTFRALLSVPFAIGCIASNGDAEAIRYLIDIVEAPAESPLEWSFQNQDCRRLLVERATIGLAVSGRAEARIKLLEIEDQLHAEGETSTRRFLIGHIREGIHVMDRIVSEGRASIFNPRSENSKEDSKP
jgi:hypothetical protein